MKADLSVLKPILCITGVQVYPFPKAKPRTPKRGSENQVDVKFLLTL